VARDLVGKVLVYDGPQGRRAARIVEVEAYLGRTDPASHAYRGPTARTGVMFDRPGFSYVYLSHGVWFCMNVVAHAPGIAGAVLLRGAEPVEGLGEDARALAGPGLLGRALGLTTDHTGWDLVRAPLHLRDAAAVSAGSLRRGPRIGIAPSETSERAWRFWLRDSRGVSRR